MDEKTIETLSISAVRDSIVRSDYLDQFIADNDKEPSWDGFVYIYNDKSKKKEKLTGRMAVQVKGTENNDFSNNEITFRVKTSDLKNYLYDGGIVFFVVYMDSSGLSKKIYYADLPPVKLRIIIDNEKGKKSKKIKLIEFPGDNNKKASIFLNCLNHCRKQASFTDAKLHTLEELEAQGILEGITSTISGYGLDPKDPEGAFLTNEVYM